MDRQVVFLSTLAPRSRERRLALAVVLLMCVAFLVAVPFARTPLPQEPLFVAVYQFTLAFCDLLTMLLLFGQFAQSRAPGLLVLACGYLFTALIALVHALTFPGLFAPSGLLHAGPQTTAWLYMFWHAGFPLTVTYYAMSQNQPRVRLRLALVVPASVACVLAAVALLTALATGGEAWLPAVMNGNQYTGAMIVVVGCVWLYSAVALWALWRGKTQSVLSLWLMVVMCVWLLDIALSVVFNAGRYDLGFYLGRIFGLGAGCFVLLVLLMEAQGLYRQLSRAEDRMVDLGTREGMTRLLSSAMDGIITIDERQRIVLFNRAAEVIFGRAAKDVLLQPLTLLMPQRFHGAHGQHVQRFAQTGVTSRRMGGSALVRGLRANGEEFPIDASISQLDTEDGKLFTVILRDVTERELAQQERAQFASEASAMVEQEKARVARELHDELAQSLTALKMDTLWLREHVPAQLDAAHAKLAQMTDMLDASVAATRRIAADLRPLLLDDLGLAAALEWLTHNFSQRAGVVCELDVDEEMELDEPYATAVFRIVQESLTNAGKHARATLIRVKVERTPAQVALSVSDNGQGFVVATPRKPHSLGLMGLRERVHLLGGSVEIHSQPGQGTRIEVVLPLP